MYRIYSLIVLVALCLPVASISQTALPEYDHVVVLILENHSYKQIIGNIEAPYINQLATANQSALFVNSYAIEHPSQPNYLDLFSGCNQGIIDNEVPQKLPFTTDNLASQLIAAGKSFITYSEDLPYQGYDGANSDNYARRHNPVTNWVGDGLHQVPSLCNQPLTMFPTDFSLLPTVSFVVPNVKNDMHDLDIDMSTITKGDTWIYDHIDKYYQWCKNHNSLLIVTFDEDDRSDMNKIMTIFCGENVKSGTYDDIITHYSVLRTLEEMYQLPYACNAALATSIHSCWQKPFTAIEKQEIASFKFKIFPNPSVFGEINIECNTTSNLQFEVYDCIGNKTVQLELNNNITKFPGLNLATGLYFYKVLSLNSILKQGVLVIN